MKRVILYLGDQGEWIAECMSPACAGQAKTKEKALAQVKRAIQFTGQLEQPDCGEVALAYDGDAVEISVYEIKSRPSAARWN